ncbi:FAD-binding protein [Halovenus sp. WSH3]|uniref:D-lactate dehydrogenase (cytochrome) n=1 Tax=Halovenus carboxidivorans TaxID=2692199 RepID=A0A6B0SZX2_9EURY|nr:FAD-binding oxidoreductase [Halovenus carboxidivorans]MXR51254.1 FAD-binding protein [Halovenus carboxidivorans]
MTLDTTFLTESLGDGQVTTGQDALEEHATDWGTATGTEPEAVVYPTTTEEVATVLEAANERGIPVTPYAAGTGLEGNAVPAEGGISMDLTRMNEVLDVRPEDFQIDLQPGVMGPTIEETAGEHGLFFPPLPSSGDISTIGGMIANAASGMQTVKYGEVADWVLELEVVLADGSVITAGSKAVKTSSGYNLRDLLIGSEGTLGVVTRATLELAGRPEQIKGGRALFPDLDHAAAAVTDAIQSGVDVAKIELIDEESAMMSNAYTGADLPDSPMVFLEFHANHGIDEEIEFCRSILETHDLIEFEIADEERMGDLWQARKDLAFAVRSYDPDRQPLHPGDITVPISKYGDLVKEIKDLGEQYDLLTPCFGHAGDGNIHYTVLVDTDDEEQLRRGEQLYSEVVDRAIEVGGTATGEHGIGQGKRKYLLDEHGSETVAAMRSIKDALDPNGILNPGKIFPETE